MRIGIDVRVLYNPLLKGIGVYLQNLLTNLAEIDQQNEYILYYDGRQNTLSRKPNSNNFIDKEISIKKGDQFYLWEQLRLPLELKRDKIDIFHSPANTTMFYLACPTIVTVHDVHLQCITQKNIIDGFYFKKLQPLILRRVKKIITPSNFSKDMVKKVMSINESKIEIVPLGINDAFRIINSKESINKIKDTYKISAQYILNVGGESSWKNISRLITAYAILVKKYQIKEMLVITGIRTKSILEKHLQEISKLNLTNKVLILGYIPEEDLIHLYNGAKVFVYPSLMEGFGLPPLEAMACGVPVVASNLTSIPEIVGDAALLFDGYNIQEIANAIYKVIINDELANELRKKGVQRVKQFNWRITAQKTLQIYKNVLENKSKL